MHPIAAFVYFVFVAAFLFIFAHPLFIGTLVALVVLQAVYFAGSKVFKTLRFGVIFGLAAVVITPIFNRRGLHVLFFLFDRPITLEAVAYGGYMMLLIIGMLAFFSTINAVLTGSKLMYLFSGVAPQTAFLINMTMRFSGEFKTKGEDYLAVQQMRDDAQNLPHIKRLAKLFGAFTFLALEDGLETADILRAKDYGMRKRTNYETYKLTAGSIVFATISAGLFAVVTVFFLTAPVYSYFRGLAQLSLTQSQWLAYGFMVFYMIIPFFGKK